jgi:hypothetical protein
MKFLKTLAAALALASIAACTQTIQSQVDAFSTIPEDLHPKTIYIAPYKGVDPSSLEWQTNARTLAKVLAGKGYAVVGDKSDARLTAYFGFAIDEGERITTNYAIPQYGITGYSGSSTYGTNYGNSYSSTTTLNPTYGVTGYTQGTRTDTVYTRSVSIDMVDNETRKKVFQSTGSSLGTCASFTSVAQPIIAGVLSNFPAGKNGRVKMPTENSC